MSYELRKDFKKSNKRRGKLLVGNRVRINNEKGYVSVCHKRTTIVTICRDKEEGSYEDMEVISNKIPDVIRDRYSDRKSGTKYHKKKRKIINDRTRNVYKIDYTEGIVVPKANIRSNNWWDCGRWDYKL